MSTLKDMHEVWGQINRGMRLFGVSAEALERLKRLTTAASDAVIEEQGLDDPDKAAALPSNTVLGEKAEAVLADLREFHREE